MFGFNYLGAVYYAGLLDLHLLYATKAVLVDDRWVDCIVHVLKDGQWVPTTVEVLLNNEWVETIG